MGPEEPETGDVEALQFQDQKERGSPGIPAFELDRERHLAVYQA